MDMSRTFAVALGLVAGMMVGSAQIRAADDWADGWTFLEGDDGDATDETAVPTSATTEDCPYGYDHGGSPCGCITDDGHFEDGCENPFRDNDDLIIGFASFFRVDSGFSADELPDNQPLRADVFTCEGNNHGVGCHKTECGCRSLCEKGPHAKCSRNNKGCGIYLCPGNDHKTKGKGCPHPICDVNDCMCIRCNGGNHYYVPPSASHTKYPLCKHYPCQGENSGHNDGHPIITGNPPRITGYCGVCGCTGNPCKLTP